MLKVPDRKNRFEPYKIGFINFWAYQNQEYPFHKGNILFRGQNGQGKSVSMQSIIPLLLDGNTHSSRIDPFGSGKRKIGDYLKVNGEFDKTRIAYLYISYRKAQTNEIITTGFGLRALDESKNDFWGFVLKEKEIGKNFKLVEPNGYDKNGIEEFIPISKDDLKKRIEEEKCGKFASTQKEYVEEVNKQVFQFESVDKFKDLTKLLIQIRSPKLSKEMKPSILYNALKNSLDELQSSDFSMISNTIKDIDDHNRKLEITQKSLKLSKVLSEEYERYREATLGNSAMRYIQAINEYKNMKKKEDGNEKLLVNQKAELLKVTELLKDIEIAIKAKKNRLDILETSTTRSLLNERKERVDEKERKETEFENRNKVLDKRKSKLHDILTIKDCSEAKSETLEKEIREIITELYELTKETQFYEGEAYIAMAEENLQNHKKERHYFNTWLSRLKGHISTLKEILSLIEEEERYHHMLEEKKKQIREVTSEIDELEKEITKLENEFENIKSQYKLFFREWVMENQEMFVPQEIIGNIMDIVENLYEFIDMTPEAIEQILYDQKEKLLDPLKQKVSNNKAQIIVRKEDIETFKKEKEKLESEKEVIPFFRRKNTEKSRKKLETQGVPFVPFYEAVEFLESTSEEEKERIESALLDMGLLDGLIVPTNFASQVKESDSIIIPQELPKNIFTLENVLKVVAPKDKEIFEEDILAVLRSISLDKIQKGTYLTVSGDYKHGLVKGNAVSQTQASFIGKEARRRYRERKISEIKEKIEKIKFEVKKFEQENDFIEERQRKLLSEYENRPQLLGLSENRNKKETKTGVKEQAEERKNKLSEAYDDISTDYKKVQFKRIEESEFLEGPKDKKTISALIQVAQSDYQQECLKAENKIINYEHQKDTYLNACKEYEEVDEDILIIKGEINVMEGDIKLLKSKIDTLDKALQQAGIKKEEEEIKKLREEIDSLAEEEKENWSKKPTCEQAIQNTQKKLKNNKKELIFLNKQLLIQEEIFQLELKTNDIVLEESLVKVAKKYEKEADTVEAQKLFDHALVEFKAQDLEGYLPSSQEVTSGSTFISVTDFPEKEDRLRIINSERQRLNVTLFVNGAKKNPREFHAYLENLEEQQRSYLKKDEERLIKNIIIQGIGQKIKNLIDKANEWKNEINGFMQALNNSIALRLTWEPINKEDKSEDYLTTSHLVNLLSKDFSVLKETDIEALSKHFMSKINLAKERLDRKSTRKEENVENLEEALKQVLDYREWYKFKIYYKLKDEEKEKVLDEKNLSILSGGEKAMAIYIPLFSAAYSKYSTASPDAPYMIALDEAFAGVDEDNISEMFALMEAFEFNYILTSQALWADYPTVNGINIYELSFDKVENSVYAEPWKWDGKRLQINEEVLFDNNIYIDEDGKLNREPFQETLFDMAELEGELK